MENTQEIIEKVRVVGRYKKIPLIYVDVTKLVFEGKKDDAIQSALGQAVRAVRKNIKTLGITEPDEADIDYYVEETIQHLKSISTEKN